MFPLPPSEGHFSNEGTPSEGSRFLRLTGGPQMFLDWGGEQVSSGKSEGVGPRFLRVQKVLQAQVWLKNGLLRPLRGTHLTWSHSSGAGGYGFAVSLLLLPN
ncbi:MAG: hypothetical protein EA422_09370 [Gemmatimonadales bacterium]|nr:MAG: hypothetical protein EA422_09370 [Gemmatimonadales bacterium]